MLILMNSDNKKTDEAIDINKISYFKAIPIKRGEDEKHFFKMVAVIEYSGRKQTFDVLSEVTEDEYFQVLSAIANKQTFLNTGICIPTCILSLYKETYFSMRLWKLYETTSNEKIKEFISKANEEIFNKMSSYELRNNSEVFKKMDEKYSNNKEYKILKYIYNYDSSRELNEKKLQDYDKGYLGRILEE